MRWLRLYDDTINDPKILKLPEAMRWHWIALLCIASKNDGVLPALEDISIQLRVTAAKATEIISTLVKAGLIDKTETGFAPHNWNGRQYKTDVTDPTAASRSKKYRDKKRDASHRDDRDVTVTAERPETEYREQKEDRIGDAGASSFTEGSKALASAFWKALGFESALAVHPDYAGTDWRAIEWEKAGWTVDLIDSETRRIGPDKPLTYYEKVFATSFAKRQAPLPTVEIREAEKLTVTHGRTGKTGDIIGASDKLVSIIDSFGAGACETDRLRGPEGTADVRLLSKR